MTLLAFCLFHISKKLENSKHLEVSQGGFRLVDSESEVRNEEKRAPETKNEDNAGLRRFKHISDMHAEIGSKSV